MLAEEPDDLLLIKLVALRTGLCVMVGQAMIDLDQATTIFETERLEAVMERSQEMEEEQGNDAPF